MFSSRQTIEMKQHKLELRISTLFLLYVFFWVIPQHLNFICRCFGTECSETSAHKIQTPGNYPEENVRRTEHGKSLKSRILCFYSSFRMFVLSNAASAEQVFETYHLSQAGLKTIFPPTTNLNFFVTCEMSFLDMHLESCKHRDVRRCQIRAVGWVWNNFKFDTFLEGSDDGVWHLKS